MVVGVIEGIGETLGGRLGLVLYSADGYVLGRPVGWDDGTALGDGEKLGVSDELAAETMEGLWLVDGPELGKELGPVLGSLAE